MTDPFPELPRRVLYVNVDGVMHVTKPFELEPVTKIPVTKTAKPVTKIDDVTKIRGRGRPAKGSKPMTAAERKRRSRSAKKVSIT